MTAQIGDTLLWKGVKHTLPAGGPLLEAWPKKNRPKFEALSTACWRGFIASWLVDDDGWLRVTSVKTGSEIRTIPQPQEAKPSKAAVRRLREEQRRRIVESFPPKDRPSEDVIDQMTVLFGNPGKAQKFKMVIGADERLYELFPGHEGPVTVTWFTGALETGHGKDVERRPDLYEVLYPHYRIFHVEAGKVVRIEDHDKGWWIKRRSKYSAGPD